MPATFKQGDTATPMTGTIRFSATGLPVNLTGCTVYLTLRHSKLETKIVDGKEVDIILPAANGQWSYTWADGETDYPGKYVGEHRVVKADGKVFHSPTVDYFEVEIVPSLDPPLSGEEDD